MSMLIPDWLIAAPTCHVWTGTSSRTSLATRRRRAATQGRARRTPGCSWWRSPGADTAQHRHTSLTCLLRPPRDKILNMSMVNEGIRVMSYAVRGPLLLRANEIEKELKAVRHESR